jgi:hypothetical protein
MLNIYLLLAKIVVSERVLEPTLLYQVKREGSLSSNWLISKLTKSGNKVILIFMLVSLITVAYIRVFIMHRKLESAVNYLL